MSNPRLLGKHHQRSSSTGSHGLLFGIGAAAGPHNIYHQPLTHQASSQSTDPLDSEDEDENSAIGTPPDVKGTLVRKNSLLEFCSDIISDLFSSSQNGQITFTGGKVNKFSKECKYGY